VRNNRVGNDTVQIYTYSFSSGRVNFTDSLVGEMRQEINYEPIYRLFLHNKFVILDTRK